MLNVTDLGPVTRASPSTPATVADDRLVPLGIEVPVDLDVDAG